MDVELIAARLIQLAGGQCVGISAEELGIEVSDRELLAYLRVAPRRRVGPFNVRVNYKWRDPFDLVAATSIGVDGWREWGCVQIGTSLGGGSLVIDAQSGTVFVCFLEVARVGPIESWCDRRFVSLQSLLEEMSNEAYWRVAQRIEMVGREDPAAGLRECESRGVNPMLFSWSSEALAESELEREGIAQWKWRFRVGERVIVRGWGGGETGVVEDRVARTGVYVVRLGDTVLILRDKQLSTAVSDE